MAFVVLLNNDITTFFVLLAHAKQSDENERYFNNTRAFENVHASS